MAVLGSSIRLYNMAFPKNTPAQATNRARIEGAAASRWLLTRDGSVTVTEQGNEAEEPLPPQTQAPLSTPLQWRSPWWLWQGVACAASTLLAPTFLAIGGLLLRDAHSDHPVFWPSLMLSVALANLLAMVTLNQLHHRRPFTDRKRLAAGYGAFSMLAGGVLFLLLGWASGFLPDFVLPLFGGGGSPLQALFWSLALALSYSLLSFAHASVLYAWLCFRNPGQDDGWLDGIGWRLG